MGQIIKEEYDPHILYHAINLTVELGYKVPMQKIYKVLTIVNDNNQKNITKVSSQEVLSIMNQLGDRLEEASNDDTPCDTSNLQAKIKELLRLLGCTLSDAELNQILKGQLSIEKALSKQAQVAWLMIFRQNEYGRYQPNKEMVDQMLYCAQIIAIENVEIKMQRALENYKIQEKSYRENEGILKRDDNLKALRSEREKNDPVELERQRNKLRLYIAHMQGYDIDHDRDGGRGIDPTTGYVVDYEDIYIADKIHGSIIDDIDRDGIDISDIR